MVPSRAESYWDRFAQSFASLGSPLRPSPQDTQFMHRAITDWAALRPGECLDALLLGVTPEIAEMQWPEHSMLTAVDKSLSMVRRVWPGNVPGKRRAVCGNWLLLPRPESSCHIVAGDGSFNCLAYPQEFRAMAAAIFAVLKDAGILILRCYLQKAAPESPEQVYADLRRGTIRSFHAFKLRLLMALQNNAQEGIAVRHAYGSWADHHLELGSLPSGQGWRKSAMDTIEYYKNSSTVYAFPTLAAMRGVLGEFFEEVSLLTPSYELGERCPTVVLRPRRNTSGVAQV
jgi:hypothetical protein